MRKRPIRKRESDWDVGDMNKRILIESPIKIPNGQGGTSDGWTEYQTVWASVLSISNNWKIDQDMKSTADLKNFVVWYDENINKKMRIVYKNKSYRITAIKDYDDAERYLRLECDGNKTDAI